MFIGLHVKLSLFLSEFNVTWIFFRQIFENTQISHLLIIRPVVAELFYVGEQTHRQKDRFYEINGRFPQLFECTQKNLFHT